MTTTKTYTFCWCPSHIGIPGNERADTDASQIITSDRVTNILIPRTDIKKTLKQNAMEWWRDQWRVTRGNKLREIKPDSSILPDTLCDNIKWCKTLTRLRIGHTHLTHSFLIERGEPPECEDCVEPLTIEHILTTCPTHDPIRLRIYGTISPTLIDMLTKHVSFGSKLHQFVTEINLINEI